MGQLIRFIPVTVVIGFTNGIAVVIFLAQIKDFFGLQIDNLPAEFFGRIKTWPPTPIPSTCRPWPWPASACFPAFLQPTGPALRLLRRAPGPLVVLIVGTLVSFLSLSLPVETIGSRFGGIPQELPNFGLPEPVDSRFRQADLAGHHHRPARRHRVAALGPRRRQPDRRPPRPQPGTDRPGPGQYRRPALRRLCRHRRHRPHHDQRQNRRPHADCRHHPRAGPARHRADRRAARLLRTARHAVGHRHGGAVNMGEWHDFMELRRYSYNYRIILLATFFVTVVFDLTIAVELGMVLASLFFIYRMSELTRIERLPLTEEADEPASSTRMAAMRVAAWQLFGSLFFGAVNKLESCSTPRRPPGSRHSRHGAPDPARHHGPRGPGKPARQIEKARLYAARLRAQLTAESVHPMLHVFFV
jgi:SulP family sulfate permease